MVGQFLGYYSQYTLEDVEAMDTDRFMFLLGAMLDCINPEATMPIKELAAKRMREKILSAKKGR